MVLLPSYALLAYVLLPASQHRFHELSPRSEPAITYTAGDPKRRIDQVKPPSVLLKNAFPIVPPA